MQTTRASGVVEISPLGVEELSNTGIDVMDKGLFGTHLCQFYESKEELLEVLVPYFETGLSRNELCICITSEALGTDEVKIELGKVVPGLARYLSQGQMQIVPHTEWYVKDGVFNISAVTSSWAKESEKARSCGYHGIRVTGDASWVSKQDWWRFMQYEHAVNAGCGDYPMLAICTYPLALLGLSEGLDIMDEHQCALVKRAGRWICLGNRDGKAVLEEIAPVPNFGDNPEPAIQDSNTTTISHWRVYSRVQRDTEIYAQEVTRAREEERKRVAHKLYGDLAQSLAILSLDSSAMTKSVKPESKDTIERLRTFQTSIAGVLEDLLRLSRELWPAELDILGWEAACKGLVMGLHDHGIKAELMIAGEQRSVSSRIGLLLTRIIQETLQNVVRYAEATRVIVNVRFTKERIKLIVADNGKGFRLPDDMSELASQEKLGLFTMKERVRLSGGHMSIHSRRGEGTVIRVDLRA